MVKPGKERIWFVINKELAEAIRIAAIRKHKSIGELVEPYLSQIPEVRKELYRS